MPTPSSATAKTLAEMLIEADAIFAEVETGLKDSGDVTAQEKGRMIIADVRSALESQTSATATIEKLRASFFSPFEYFIQEIEEHPTHVWRTEEVAVTLEDVRKAIFKLLDEAVSKETTRK